MLLPKHKTRNCMNSKFLLVILLAVALLPHAASCTDTLILHDARNCNNNSNNTGGEPGPWASKNSVSQQIIQNDTNDEVIAGIAGARMASVLNHFERQLTDVSTAHASKPSSLDIHGAGAVSSTNITTASHNVQWSVNASGCNFSVPNVTISCGIGGVITLVEQDPSVQGCSLSKKSLNSVVCSRIANPETIPSVVVVCSGTTPLQLAVTIQLRSVQVKCGKNGGIAQALAFLGRYCLDRNGTVSIKSKFRCISGISKTIAERTFCYAKSVATSSLRTVSLGGVSMSDLDTTSSCVNVGPNLSTMPTSYHVLTWTSNSGASIASGLTNVTVRCENGGLINVTSKSKDVVGCTLKTASIYNCAKRRAGISQTVEGTINFKCQGRAVGQLGAVAVLESAHASWCRGGGPSQMLYLARICRSGATEVEVPSRLCGNSSQLQWTEENVTYCRASSIRCRVYDGSVSVSGVVIMDPSPNPLCIFY